MGVCLRVLEASTLALSARELELYGRLRLTPTVADCWQKTFLSQCDSMTSGRYVESNTPIRAPEECDTLPGLTSSAEDSPVRTSPMPGSEPESTGNARDCGASLPASFASYDPATSSWRTSQLCLDGEWQSIRASDVGAPHRRERIWIVAYPSGISSESRRRVGDMGSAEAEGIGEASQRERIWNAADDCGSDVPDTAHAEVRTGHEEIRARTGTAIPIGPGNIRPSLAYAQQSRLERYSGDGAQRAERPQPQRPISAPRVFHTTDDSENSDGIRRGDSAGQWRAEPDVGRVAHGISSRVDRLRGLGNAVVPQITEWIGRRIVEAK